MLSEDEVLESIAFRSQAGGGFFDHNMNVRGSTSHSPTILPEAVQELELPVTFRYTNQNNEMVLVGVTETPR